MPTDCIQDLLDLTVEGRAVVADFDGGTITSDAGALLLARRDAAIGSSAGSRPASATRAAGADRAHEVRRWSASASSAWRSGYEDLIDHDELRHDPVMAILPAS